MAALLAGETLGIRIGATRNGRTPLEIVLESPAAADRACGEAARLLRGAGLDPVACGLRRTGIADKRWLESYRASLAPFRLGRRFVVQPGRQKSARGRAERIVLAPGRAFGTGEHPTTQLCVRALERCVVARSRWVDLGCGTAILAIVAHRCGAAEVLALDDDPSAVQVAGGVVRDNGAGRAVSVRLGSLDGAEPGGWDGVACNIGAGFVQQGAARLAALLRPGGWLVAAGFLTEELPGTRDALTAAGFQEQGRDEAGPWSLLIMRRA